MEQKIGKTNEDPNWLQATNMDAEPPEADHEQVTILSQDLQVGVRTKQEKG